MKAFLLFVPGVLLLTAPLRAQLPPSAPDIPTLTAVTAGNGKRTSTGVSGNTYYSAVTRDLSVHVELSSFHKPAAPYDVQVFFISGAESGHSETPRIFNCQRVASGEIAEKFDFKAPPITGTTTSTTVTNVTITNGFQSANGTLTSSHITSGEKFNGWVVRVLSGGVVVRVASNQAGLQYYAERNPEIFDAAILKAKPAR